MRPPSFGLESNLPDQSGVPGATSSRIPLPHFSSVSNQPLRLPEIFKTGLKCWRIVLPASLAGMLLGLIAASFEPTMFRATTSIEIQNLNGDFLNIKRSKPMDDGSNGPLAVVNLQTQMELLESSKVIQNTKLAMKRMESPERWAPGTRKGDRSTSLDAVLDRIAGSVNAQKVKETRVIQVQVKDTRVIQINVDAANPILAADFANTLVAQYIQESLAEQGQMTSAAEASTRLELAAIRKKLEESEKQLESYATQHQLVFAPERQIIADDRIRQLQGDISKVHAELTEREGLQKLAIASPGALPEVVEDDELRSLRIKFEGLKRQEAVLLAVFRPDYTEVKKVQAQEKEIAAAMDGQRQRILTRLASQVKQASERQRILSEAYQSAVKQTNTESATAVQYDLLKHEVDTNLAGYQSMLARLKELAVAAALRTNNVRVIDRALPPEHRFLPRTSLNAVLGLFAGFTLSMGFVVAQERMDEKIRQPGEAFTRLGVAELAAIPSDLETLEKPAARAGFLMPPVSAGDEFALTSFLDLDDYPATVDCFRTLSASVLLSGPKNKPPKSVLVASCFDGDGKTTVASHLAIALARTGRRVLFLDGNLRNPELHALFGLPNTLGVADILEGRVDVTEAENIVMNTKATRLHILCAGVCSSKTADLLFDPRFAKLLDRLHQKFDLVVIDSPALLRKSDARLIARYTDGVILVARADQTKRNAVKAACDRFRMDGSAVLGMVLNGCRRKHSLIA